MGIFNGIIGKSKENYGETMLDECLDAGKIMLESNQRSKGAIFEVLIFCSHHILKRYHDKRPNFYNDFQEEYFEALYKFAIEKGIHKQIQCELPKFIDSRFHLNQEQINSLYLSPKKLYPTKIVYNFYEKPLSIDSGNSVDISAIMRFILKLKYLYEDLERRVEDIIKKIDWDKIPKNYIKDFRFHYNQGVTKFNLKDFQGAIFDFSKSIELVTHIADLYYLRGSARIQIKEYKEAINDFTITIDINPNNAKAYYARYTAKIMNNEYNASSDYKMAIELDPSLET